MTAGDELQLWRRLRRLEKAAGIALWEWKIPEDRITWSPHTAVLFGIDRTPERYEDFIRVLHPEDQERVRAEGQRFLVEGGPFSRAFRVVDRHGAIRWILDRGETILDAHGQPLLMHGINIDITAQKDVEALLAEERAASRSSEARLRAAQEAAQIGIYEWDILADEISWDRYVRNIWGLGEDEPITYAVFASGLHRDDLEETTAAVQRALDPQGTGAFEAEYRVIHRGDGRLRWVHATGRATFVDGRATRLLGAVYDVSARREAEASLRVSEARFRLALSAVAGVAYDWDLKTDRASRSEGLERLIGVPNEDADETRDWWSERIHPVDLAKLVPQMQAVLGERAETYAFEYRVKHSGGHWVDVHDHGRVIFGANGDTLRVVGITFDISHRKRAEAQRELLIDELNHRVRNILTIIRAIATQTRRHTTSLEAFGAAFERRIQALSDTHTLLSRLGWSQSRLHAIIAHQVATYASAPQHLDAAGPEVLLGPKAALALSLVFHELASNAAKYGALTAPAGRIEVRWSIQETPTGRRVELAWTEAGGPPVESPAGMGFGSKLMDINVTHEFGGSIERTYRPDGLVCVMTLPLPSDDPG